MNILYSPADFLLAPLTGVHGSVTLHDFVLMQYDLNGDLLRPTRNLAQI